MSPVALTVPVAEMHLRSIDCLVFLNSPIAAAAAVVEFVGPVEVGTPLRREPGDALTVVAFVVGTDCCDFCC